MLPTDKVTVAIYHKDTGAIRQIATVPRENAHLQHASFPGHEWIVVPDNQPGAHPGHHMVDLASKKLVKRVVPMDEARVARLRDLERKCIEVIAGGFLSAATGRPIRYCSSAAHQTDFLHAVHVGGDLEAQAEPATAHTPEQGRAVLADFVRHRDAARRHLAALRVRLEAAKTHEELQSINWNV